MEMLKLLIQYLNANHLSLYLQMNNYLQWQTQTHLILLQTVLLFNSGLNLQALNLMQ